MTPTLRALALPTALAATLALASCGTSSSVGGHDASGMSDVATSAPGASGTAATGATSAADVAFSTGTILHHAQAIEMADLALKQATDAKVKALARKVKAAQVPEIARMSGWLKAWGAQVPGTAGGHDMSDSGGQMGMMSAQEMTDLDAATGSAFDRMWLQMMTRHHQGAVAMARTELAQGANPEGKRLAQSIIDSQTTEIAEMNSILTGISG